MAEKREPFAMEIINEIAKRRNCWRLAFCVSLATNIIQAAVLIFR